MKLNVSFMLLIFLVACSGHNGHNYEVDDVIAVLNGEEIKAKDILTQYPLDDESIERYLKEEIMISEAKKMGIALSNEEIEEWVQELFPGFDSLETGERMEPFGRKEFFKEQAATLNIPKTDYFDLWFAKHFEREANIREYIHASFPVLEEELSEEELEEWGQKFREHISELINAYEENGDLLMVH